MAGDRLGRLARGQPLPTRLHPGAPSKLDPAASWAELQRLVASLKPDWDRQRSACIARLRACLDAGPPDAMTPAGAVALYDDLFIAIKGSRYGFWRHRVAPHPPVHFAATQFVRWLVGSQGGRTAAEAADRIRISPPYRIKPNQIPVWTDPFCLALREVLVRAPDEIYEAARETWAEIGATEGWRARATFAFLLADDRPAMHALQPLAVLLDAVSDGASPATELALVPLIAEVRPSAAAAWRNHRRGAFSLAAVQIMPDDLAATLAATASRHGEPALPGLAWLYHQSDRKVRAVLAKAILATRDDDAFATLLPALQSRWVRAAVARAEALDPGWVFGRCLAALIDGRGEPGMRARVLEMVERHGLETARHWARGIDAAAAIFLDGLTEGCRIPLAPRELLPAVLREPPWQDAWRRPFDRIALTIAPLPTPIVSSPLSAEPSPREARRRANALVLPSLVNLPQMIAMIEATSNRWNSEARLPPSEPLPPPSAMEAETLAWLDRRLTELDASGETAARAMRYGDLVDGLERQPAALALMIWNRGGPLVAAGHEPDELASAMLHRFGEAAVPGLRKLLTEGKIGCELARVAEVDAAEIATASARTSMRSKAARDEALAWLRRFRRTAFTRLVPPAVGPAGRERDEAGVAIRRLVADGAGAAAELHEIVACYAAQNARVVDAVAEVLGHDLTLQVPDRVAPLPDWFRPAVLSRPILRTGQALPDEAVVALGEMLSFSTRSDVYAGIAVVRNHCTAESLDRFVWDLFAAWLARGAPGQQGWIIRAVGWLGHDGCARRLPSVIRKWIDSKARPQAAMALQALFDIGSDAAATELAGLAERLGSKSLRGKAILHLATLAESRGLTGDELADLATPTLGLDPRGGIDIDFGARRFRAELDATLKPVLFDEAGARLRDLPKPRRTDDAGLATEAQARWRVLKRDARSIASLQLLRMEAMLASSRRVSPADFRNRFAAHPLIGQLSRRLVWGVYDDDALAARPTATFRLTEGSDPLSVDDEPGSVDLGSKAGRIGLVHPLSLEQGLLEAWRGCFAKHGLTQPFPQLCRTVYALTGKERASPVLYRFHDVRVDAGWLRGMVAKGWPFGRPVEDGLMWTIERDLVLSDGATARATLDFAPGLLVGTPEPAETPRILGDLLLGEPSENGTWKPVPFGRLAPATASELILAIAGLAARGRHPLFAESHSSEATMLQ